jgi:hypothetical protein
METVKIAPSRRMNLEDLGRIGQASAFHLESLSLEVHLGHVESWRLSQN